MSLEGSSRTLDEGTDIDRFKKKQEQYKSQTQILFAAVKSMQSRKWTNTFTLPFTQCIYCRQLKAS